MQNTPRREFTQFQTVRENEFLQSSGLWHFKSSPWNGRRLKSWGYKCAGELKTETKNNPQNLQAEYLKWGDTVKLQWRGKPNTIRASSRKFWFLSVAGVRVKEQISGKRAVLLSTFYFKSFYLAHTLTCVSTCVAVNLSHLNRKWPPQRGGQKTHFRSRFSPFTIGSGLELRP